MRIAAKGAMIRRTAMEMTAVMLQRRRNGNARVRKMHRRKQKCRLEAEEEAAVAGGAEVAAGPAVAGVAEEVVARVAAEVEGGVHRPKKSERVAANHKDRIGRSVRNPQILERQILAQARVQAALKAPWSNKNARVVANPADLIGKFARNTRSTRLAVAPWASKVRW